jgi:hypothetical protein
MTMNAFLIFTKNYQLQYIKKCLLLGAVLSWNMDGKNVIFYLVRNVLFLLCNWLICRLFDEAMSVHLLDKYYGNESQAIRRIYYRRIIAA